MASARIETKSDNQLGLNDADWAEVKRHGRARNFQRGEALWNAGDDPDTVWLIQNGRVNMSIGSMDGGSSIVHFCTKAQSFCPAAAVNGKPYPCSALAAGPVEALGVPRSVFNKALDRLPKLARELVTGLAKQVCEAHEEQALMNAPVRSRLAGVLGRLNRQFAGAKLNFTRAELAAMTGTTVETAIRTLSDWEKQGIIQSERGSVRVRNADELMEAAH